MLIDRPILVTGINGFLASTLAERLVAMGYRVVGIVKDYNFKSRREILDKCSIVRGDIRDFDCVRYAISHYEVGSIYHLAAVTILRKSVTNPLDSYGVNVMGTVNVLEAARQLGTVDRIVCKSTDKSYSTYEQMPYVETMKVQASPDAYSTSKACMDMISQQYAMGYGMNISIIRCGNAYGQDLNLSRLIPGSIVRCLDGQRPILHAGVRNYAREFMYSEDVIDAYLTVAEKGFAGEAYNIGGAGRLTVYETVKMIMKKMGMEGEPETKECNFKEIKDQWLDSTKLQNLGWKCKHDLSAGLDKTIPWYAAHRDKYNFFEGEKS